MFEISAYLTELSVPGECKFAGRTLHELVAAVKDDADVLVIGLVRAGQREEAPSTYEVLRQDDILLVEADSDSLKTLLDVTGLELAAKADGKDEKKEDGEKQEKAEHGELTLVEAIVTPGSMLVGTTATGLDLRERHGVNILAVARQGKRLRERLGRIRFAAGDILPRNKGVRSCFLHV